MWEAVERLRDHHPTSSIEAIDLPREWLKDATSPKNFITPTALGRMFLPRLTAGRVLYLDGDTLVTGDLWKAAEIDLAGKPLGGVRDFSVLKWRAIGKSGALARQAALFDGEVELTNYINSGVLLMDCDAIRSDALLQAQMEDMVAAQGYPTVDQDRINAIFHGRITHLDPVWNCSWGRLTVQRRHGGALPTTGAETQPVVLHFHGPNKPWHGLRLSSLKKGGLSVFRYRRAMTDFQNTFPELAAA